MMRICVITNEDLSLDRGPTRVLRNLVTEWSRRHQVTLITIARKNRFLKGVRLIEIRATRYSRPERFDPLWFLYSLRAGIRLGKYDVILDNVGTVPLLFMARIRKKRVFCLIHGNQYQEAVLNNESL